MRKNFDKDLYVLSYKMKKELQKRIIFVVLNIFTLVILLNLVLNFCIFSVREYSDSMSPDIPKNALVFVTPISTEIKRGDVLYIEKHEYTSNVPEKILDTLIKFFTLQKLNLHSKSDNLSSSMSLRRVVGVPGDTLYMKDFMIYIRPKNDKHFLTEFERAEKVYNIEIENLPKNWDVDIGEKSAFTPITLSAGQYFVLADNRFSAMDSRLWGIVEKEDVIGKVILQYYPFNSFKLF